MTLAAKAATVVRALNILHGYYNTAQPSTKVIIKVQEQYSRKDDLHTLTHLLLLTAGHAVMTQAPAQDLFLCLRTSS
jgi:hypothetical protein